MIHSRVNYLGTFFSQGLDGTVLKESKEISRPCCLQILP